MNCSVPANQPIYQALLDKAAEYPASATQKLYQAAAYKKAAESVLTHTWNIYDIAKNNSWYQGQGQHIPGAGEGIRTFIKDFIRTEVFTPEKYSEKAMEDARKIAAQNAPKTDLFIPSERFFIRAYNIAAAAGLKVTIPTPKTALDFYYESLKPVIYTAENPRRSKRVANKPKVEYFTKEEEQDETAEAIEAVCAKKGYEFSEDLITEFEAWLPTADKYSTQKYDWCTGKDIPRAKPDVAKYWTQYYSKNIQEQKKLLALSKALIKYCQKNNIEYKDVMGKKFAAWKADPANKSLITYTSYSGGSGCNCGSCNPTGAPRETKQYSYEHTPAYCINKWFSTLKKTVIF